MPEEFDAAFASLKKVLARCRKNLQVTTDSDAGYVLETVKPSPFPQHKGHPMFFGAVKTGKAYVSLHLMPLYMNEELAAGVPAGLRKRMQGKTCFNFKQAPEAETVKELEALAKACWKDWEERGWL
jgi:hypothetical protein